jgi:flavin reductase (DIM6/NTAB) family NADH-FMN oxidoreductase RutF
LSGQVRLTGVWSLFPEIECGQIGCRLAAKRKMMTSVPNPTIDTLAFRQALGQFPTGVCVVTCAVDGERFGMTMSSFNSVSLEPPLVLFSIDRRAASLKFWLKAKAYAINVLSETQRDLSNHFARRNAKKWEAVAYSEDGTQAPILPGVAALFECVPWANHEAGDHSLFIAEVKRFTSFPDRLPLVFSRGSYAVLQSLEIQAALWPLDLHY